MFLPLQFSDYDHCIHPILRLVTTWVMRKKPRTPLMFTRGHHPVPTAANQSHLHLINLHPHTPCEFLTNYILGTESWFLHMQFCLLTCGFSNQPLHMDLIHLCKCVVLQSDCFSELANNAYLRKYAYRVMACQEGFFFSLFLFFVN